ncbi:SLBB domain-containing protein [Marinobacter sp.]|uniref:SLBB domain-containing protein n=1 Tax=Marinobacter sp. TaxID=50741 RepID=UPI00384E7DDF
MAVTAQSISQSQIDQFKSLPKAQQESLARQYGIDLDQITGGSQQQKRPQQVELMNRPTDRESEEEQDKKEKEEREEKEDRKKNGGLEPFGYDLFAGQPSTFAPVTEIPIPLDYILGPGDVLKVQLWGKENQQLELPISRDGTISFPNNAPISVAGLSFDEARQQIKKLVSEQYIGVQASVGLGELRSMRVFILGEARTPGAYTVSSLSTITNALFVSGGIKRNGSLRNIQHKRNGKVVAELDLYDLLLKGDTSNDRRLQPGDVIFIPPVGTRAGIDGEVYRPALYELNGTTSLQELVRLAGGLTPQAYPQRVKIERTNDDFLRIIAEADLTSAKGQQSRVEPGDRIQVASIADITGQYVAISGAATRPGRYAWVPGMRFSSLIGSLQSDLDPVADQSIALIVRTNPENDRLSTLTVDLRQAVRNKGTESDLLLQEKDEILIFADLSKADLSDLESLGLKAKKEGLEVEEEEKESRSRSEYESKEKSERAKRQQLLSQLHFSDEKLEELDEFDRERLERLENLRDWQREKLLEPVITRLEAQATPKAPMQTIEVNGEVRFPGRYPMPQTRSVEDAIFIAGGLRDSASLLTAELARFEQDPQGDGRTQILQLDLTQGLTTIDVKLESRDQLLIKPIPAFATRNTIQLQGEVRFPGEYTFQSGESLNDVIRRAGGLTDNAFPEGAVFTREKLREREAERLKEAEERLQSDLLGVQLEGDSFGGQSTQRLGQVQNLLEDVQSARPVGRMVINLPAVLQSGEYPAIRLQDGDRLTVPTIPQAVSVFGEVQFPTSHLHRAGLTVDDYLERSGGPTRQADAERIYVIKADGSVLLPQESRWFGGRSQQLSVGDTIIVPIDVDRINQLELWTNVSQIVYQMALGAAAVGNL